MGKRKGKDKEGTSYMNDDKIGMIKVLWKKTTNRKSTQRRKTTKRTISKKSKRRRQRGPFAKS